ncbi:MAG TPA: DNA-formamidopyrimidine glycosylase [Dehalococcoidia bacterium]|nr:DNA-formamidopyrimidine glycosylase [Dehalococcoidia bacterium]
MPELPEVETIKNELAPCITGRRIIAVELPDTWIVKEPIPDAFIKSLTGSTIKEIERRGKYLIVHLSNRKYLIIHLRMTGALLFNCPDDRYVRAIFRFDGGDRLAFSDRRRLGVLRLVCSIRDLKNKLGPEPLDKGFTSKKLAEKFKGRNAPIKAVLLDQQVVAGVGNMYADELLFMAKIHPLRRTDSLTEKEIKTIHTSMLRVLKSAIAGKGASVDTYKRPDGNEGTAHTEFAVAHQLGKPCPRCSTPIQRLMIRNRGSYYCPSCQRQS